MSEPFDDTAVEPVETAQAAVEPTSETPVPWGDDFNAERAWKTITHLRDREKELEKQAKEFERLQSDPDAFREFVSQRGYELPDEDEPEPDEDESPEFRDPRVDQLLAERETERRQQITFEVNAKELEQIQESTGRDLTKDEIETLTSLAMPDKDGIPHIKPVWDAIQKLTPTEEPAKVTPSRVPPKGGPGEETVDMNDRDQRVARLQAAVDAAQAGRGS